MVEENIYFDNYIKDMLNQDHIKLNFILQTIRTFYNESLYHYYRNLEYKDYLLTGYWLTIKKYKIFNSQNTCEKCKTKNQVLNVHHKNYYHIAL